MPPSSLAVVPVSARHVPAVGALLARTLDDDPAYRYLFPNDASRRRGLTDFFVRHLRTHLPYHCSYALAERDEVVATVTIRPPGGVPISLPTMLRRGLLPFAMSHGPRAVKRLLLLKSAYDAIEEKAAVGPVHRLVHMMAVAPERQGRGIGSGVLHEAIGLSIDAHGGASLPVLLTTHTERNVTFYRKSGFEVADRRELLLDGGAPYAVWTMLRPQGPGLFQDASKLA